MQTVPIMLPTRMKRPKNASCLAMTLYGIIGLKRVKCGIYMQHLTNTTPILHLHASKCRLQNQAVSSLPMHNPTVPDLPQSTTRLHSKFACYRYIIIHNHQSHVAFTCNLTLLVHQHSQGLHAVTHLDHAVPNHHSPWLCCTLS